MPLEQIVNDNVLGPMDSRRKRGCLMTDLFVIDRKDYDPEGKVYSRPSVRGVIMRNGKLLLIYSKKFDYYKFAGGGIEKDEDHKTALIREVREETGFIVIPESVTEYGRVLRRNKDTFTENGIFEQENFYYFCDIEDEKSETELDDYEADEGFTAVWMNPFDASLHNRELLYSKAAAGLSEAKKVMIKREMRVLDMLDLVVRKKERERRTREHVQAFGIEGLQDILDFVEENLKGDGSEDIEAKTEINYSRFDHTKRVLGWAKRLYDTCEDKSGLRYEDVMIATAFHDVGRIAAMKDNSVSHAKAGVPITGEYLASHGFSKERTEYICMLVGKHSDKYMMADTGIDKGLLMLMEADMLDDMGAQGIVMDCMITEARNSKAKFEDCLDHISRFTLRLQKYNPMVTPNARSFWEEKTEQTEKFVALLKRDLEL